MNVNGRPITDVLGEIQNGDFLAELTDALYEVVRATQETHKKGSIKISLSIAPTGRGSVQIDANFSASVPEHDRPSTTFFVDNRGTLLRDDPRQEKLPLREVVDNTTGEVISVER